MSLPNVDLASFVTNPGQQPRTGVMSSRLVGSEILKIAGEVKELIAKGQPICDLTVGDFSAKEFPIPDVLLEETVKALKEGHTNYPPSDGVLECRQAVIEHTARAYGVRYPLQSVLIAGGARPILYGAFRALLNEGDKAVYPLPSWNNNHYMVLTGAKGVEVPSTAADGFFPQVDAFKPLIRDARILFMNSPLNPAGTMVTKEALTAVCDLVLEENQRRQAAGQPALFFMYDQVYAGLTFGGAVHQFPMTLRPEMARYTVVIDGISKCFSATGLRVGWALGPVDVVDRMKAILGHVGAWAPRAEQVATARLLNNPGAMSAFNTKFLEGLNVRLGLLHRGLQAMKGRGLSVESIEPQGAIYLSVRLNLLGKKTKAGGTLTDAESIRKFVLEEAGMAVVPFSAFGMHQEPTWFRASVGAVSPQAIESVMPRLEKALATLS